MLETLLTCDAWDRSSADEQRAAVAAVEQAVAPRLRFERLATYALGDQTHTIARFISDDGATFALLPGYQGLLGYDPARHPQPSELQADPAEVADMAWSFETFFQYVLRPLRSVRLRPFLLETVATPQETVERTADGWWRHFNDARREDVLARVTAEGFRFPTSDEWEYACSGGSRAFYRWGNTWPPIEWSPAARRGTEEWREDLQPNAFGLRIALHPQELEYCAEPEVVRGGDGGTAVSVGVGRKTEWLTCATAYQYPFTAAEVAQLGNAFLRRALSLPEAL